MYKEVLVPLSGGTSDERVVTHAIAMAQLTNAQVHIVQVLDSTVSGLRERPIDPVEWHVRKLEAEAYLDGVAERFRSNGIKVAEVLLEGQASEHFINYAHNANTELVVMAGDHDGGSTGALGSELLWRSFVSTLLVRPVGSSSSLESADDLGGSLVEENLDDPSDDDYVDGVMASDDVDGQEGVHTSLHAALTAITVSRWRPQIVAPTVLDVGLGRAPTRPQRVSGNQALVSPGTSPRSTLAGALVAGGAEQRPTGPRLLPPDTVGKVHYVSARRLTEGEGQQLGGLRFRRVMVALDGSKRSECVLSWVRLVAEKHGAQVLLAHVVADPELPRLVPASQEDIDLARQLLERNYAEASAYLKDAQARLGVDSQIRLEVGHRVATKLHDIVASEQVDLVVMSAHGYGGESRWPFGDVATNFIGYGRTTLLMVQDMPRRPGGRSRGDVTTERWGG